MNTQGQRKGHPTFASHETIWHLLSKPISNIHSLQTQIQSLHLFLIILVIIISLNYTTNCQSSSLLTKQATQTQFIRSVKESELYTYLNLQLRNITS